MRISDWSSDVCSSDLKSIDDFAHAFFGMRDGDWGVLTYTLDDVVATLNGIQPYDWAGFLNERLNDTSTHAPLAGFTNNGYKLVYTDEPSAYLQAIQKNYHRKIGRAYCRESVCLYV